MAVSNTGEVTDLRTSILASKTLAELPIEAFAGVCEEFIVKSRDVIASRPRYKSILDRIRSLGGQNDVDVLTAGVGFDTNFTPVFTDEDEESYIWLKSSLRNVGGHDQQITINLNDALGFGVNDFNIYVGGIISDTPVNIGAKRLAVSVAYSINNLTNAVLEQNWGGA